MKLEQRLRSTDLNNMFFQQLNYQKHRKKLQQLSSRKIIQSDRLHQLQSIKVRKHNTFVKEMIERNNNIGRDNGRIYEKLKLLNQVGHTNTAANEIKEASHEITPYRKKQIIETHRENMRLTLRLKSLQVLGGFRVSSINTKKIEEEYERNVKIKSRISRYESSGVSDRKIPKSQKFLNMSLSRSIRSIKTSKNQPKKDQSTTVDHHVPANVKPIRHRIFTGSTGQDKTKSIFQRSIEAKPRTIASFYNRDDIIRNRISHNNTMMTQSKRNQYRQRLSAMNSTHFVEKQKSRSRSKSQDRDHKANTFFATQIPKERSSKEHKYTKSPDNLSSKKPSISKK